MHTTDTNPSSQSSGKPSGLSSADETTGEPASPDEPGPWPGAASSLDIIDDDQRLDADRRQWLTRSAHQAMAEALAGDNRSDHDVRLCIVNDDAMALLQGRHKNAPTPTDVLTFDLRDEPQKPLDVDIVVCFDVAQRRASERCIRVERELLLYFVHGLLHCLGFDDHDENASQVMHAREDEILTSIGVGKTFNAPACEQERTL